MGSQFDTLWESSAEADLDDVFGVDVVLARGADTTGTFTATWEDVDYEIRGRDGFMTRAPMRVYRFRASDVVLVTGGLVDPRAGDRLVETIDGTERKFELMRLGESLPATELSGDGLRWLVRTKQVV